MRKSEVGGLCGSAGAGTAMKGGRRSVRGGSGGAGEEQERCAHSESGGGAPRRATAHLERDLAVDCPPRLGDERRGQDDERGRAPRVALGGAGGDKPGEDEGAEVGQDRRHEREHGKVEELHARRTVRETCTAGRSDALGVYDPCSNEQKNGGIIAGVRLGSSSLSPGSRKGNSRAHGRNEVLFQMSGALGSESLVVRCSGELGRENGAESGSKSSSAN
ncbi:hypothetical protein JB92DRAFT_3095167 [Gautieria morchelliformis]|nr:hypothetical protein JB92DRAFT_3095167 [Gautieria morchelliformis]